LASRNASRAELNASKAELNAARAEAAALESQRQLGRANQALATEILADLDLTPDQHFTARQRNALWKLAAGEETVRAHFTSALSASPEDVVRNAAGFMEVSRSLGLQWPTSADAEKLLTTGVSALSPGTSVSVVRPVGTNALGEALMMLAAKLTEAQTQPAQATILQQMGKTTDPHALGALARALQAVPATLTDAQTQQALALLLQQGDTVDLWELQALAVGLEALAASYPKRKHNRRSPRCCNRSVRRLIAVLSPRSPRCSRRWRGS
jgi:hypothetical protein